MKHHTRPSGARQDQHDDEPRSTGYTASPNQIVALKLPWRVEMLIDRLMRHRWEPGASVTIFIRTLAAEMNCSTRTVDRAIADAVRLKLLVVTQNRWASRSLGPSTYFLTAAVTTVYFNDGTCQDVAAQRPPRHEVATAVAQYKNTPRQKNTRTEKDREYDVPIAPASYGMGRLGAVPAR